MNNINQEIKDLEATLVSLKAKAKAQAQEPTLTPVSFESKGELASKAGVMMKRNNAIIMACLMVDPDFVPDYLSGNQEHFTFYYQSAEMGMPPRWVMMRSYTCNYGPCVSTPEKWKEAAALLKEWGIE